MKNPTKLTKGKYVFFFFFERKRQRDGRIHLSEFERGKREGERKTDREGERKIDRKTERERER